MVIGLGNPILGDDGVGWRVAEEIARNTINQPDVEVDCASLGGLSLMERLTGYERVILVDSIRVWTGILSGRVAPKMTETPFVPSRLAEEL